MKQCGLDRASTSLLSFQPLSRSTLKPHWTPAIMKYRCLSSALHLILTSNLPSIAHCYILQPGCEPYRDDIRRGVQDYQYSTQAAQAALAPQEATNSQNVIMDWTGLLTPLFPGLTGMRDITLHGTCRSICPPFVLPLLLSMIFA